MKKQRNQIINPDIIRQEARKILDKNSNSQDSALSEADVHKLLQRLKARQLELEMQNAKLRKAEASLRESEARHRTVLEMAPNNILEVNKQGIILYSNSILPDYISEDVIGKNFIEMAPLEYQGKIKMALELVFDMAANQSYQSRSLCENGEMKCFESNVSPVIASGIVKSAIIIVNDITDLIRVAERQRTILDAAMDGFALINIEGFLLDVNEAFCQISGYSKQKLLLMRLSELQLSENEDEINAQMQKIIERGEDRFETQFRRMDGRVLDIEFSVQFHPVDGGQFVVFLHDITDRKSAEKALKNSEAKFRNYIDFAPHGVFIANQQGGYFDVNSAGCKITGYSKDELLSMKLIELVPEESLKYAAEHFKKAVNEGFATGEFAFIRKNRSQGYWSVDTVKLSDQSLIAFVVDITERKKTEEALLYNENLLKSVLELLPVGVWIFNEKGDIILGNAAVQNIWAGVRYLGMEDFGEYKGWWLNSGKLIEPYEWSAARAIQKGETSIDEEIEIECFDGTHKIILNSAVPILNNDGIIRGAIVTNRDITGRKKGEAKIRQLNEELEERVKDRTSELQKANALLQQAEKKYRTVADYTYGWEFWTKPNGDFLYCSPSCERITGYKVSDFLKNPGLLHDIIHPADLKFFKCHKKKEDMGREGNLEINYRIIRSNGSICWIGHLCQPIFDESGKLVGTRGSNRDITSRINIEQQLKTSSQKYKLLSENITDGIFICRDGIFEYVNNAMNHIFAYRGNELLGMKLTQLIMPDYLDELEIFHHLKVSIDRIHNVEIECFRKDLSTVFVEFLFNHIGNERLIYGVVHNITEKKQTQKNIVKAIIQTEEKERAHFSKELHDGLGPLLSTIKLYLQWSERAKTNISRVEIIHKAEEILEEALSTAKEISNKLSPHLLINHGLSSAIQSFIGKLEESSGIKINFVSDVRRRLGDEIEAAIYRAIIECLNNTIKHSGAKNISILLNDAESQLLLHYRDDGIGFNLAETLNIKKGLGLFNLQNRIQTIGGKINLYSTHGKGVDYQITVNL